MQAIEETGKVMEDPLSDSMTCFASLHILS